MRQSSGQAMNYRWVSVSTLAAVLVLFGAACATNPVTSRHELAFMSETQEIALGRQADVEIRQEMGVYDDPLLQAYVDEIGMELATRSHRPELPWQFTIVNSPAVNAFALPGGFIYLTRGIMAYLGNEAELAGVLGHEIGHITARHVVQAYTRVIGVQLGLVLGQIFVPPMRANPYGTPGLSDLAANGLGLLFLKFGRDDEIQADRLGAEYVAAASWDPQGVADMLTTLARIDEVSDGRGVPNWLSTHPDPADRVVEVEPTVAKVSALVDSAALRVNRGGYLERLQGLRFGDNPEKGVVRGNQFLHPALRFALEFPEGWEVQNSEMVVLAKLPRQEIYIVLQLGENLSGQNLEEVAENGMQSAGYRIRSGNRITVNGLEAFWGLYESQVGNSGLVFAHVAHIRVGNSVYVFGGFGPSEEFKDEERNIQASIRSFRRLSKDEADDIRPNEVALYDVKSGDTWQVIAQRDGEEIVLASTLAIMNGYAVNEQPLPGNQIKVVVPGEAKDYSEWERE